MDHADCKDGRFDVGFLISLLRDLLTALTALAALLVLAAVGWNAFLISWHADACRTLSQSIPSPDGSWVVERYICRYGNAEDNEQLSLRRSTEPAGGARYPFLHVGSSYQHGVKWLDNQHLLVVSDGTRNYPKKLTSYRGVNIAYEVYSPDPDVFRNQSTASIVDLPSTFSAKFWRSDNSTESRIARCSLEFGTASKIDSETLRIRLDADKYYREINRQYNSIVPESTHFYIHFEYINDYKTLSSFVTTGSFNGRIPPDTSSAIYDDRVFNKKFSNWQDFAWGVRWNIENSEFKSIFESIREKYFKVSLGLWLENAKINFHSDKIYNSHLIDDFAKCLNDHKL